MGPNFCSHGHHIYLKLRRPSGLHRRGKRVVLLSPLRQEDLGTEFVIKHKGSRPEVLWTTSMENCYGLALSPDDRYVAFVCEQSGVVVATP